MKHKKEITRWANCPDNTEVWYRACKNDWDKIKIPHWLINVEYIVDDKYAELRKALAEGKTILFRGKEVDNLNFDKELEDYSIQENFTPVLKRSIRVGRVICFTGPTKGIVIDDNCSGTYAVGDVIKNVVHYNNEFYWEDVK